MMNAINTKLLLAILVVLTLIIVMEVKRNQPVQMDPITANKLSNAARPLDKPFLVP